MRGSVDVEVDLASSEEGRDVVQRGVKGERGLKGARHRSVRGIEGPSDNRSVLTRGDCGGCSNMEVSHSHLFDVGGIKYASGV